MESVTDGQHHRLMASGHQALDGHAHCRRGPADDRLLGAVDVRDDDVAVDVSENFLDLLQRREDGRHEAVVGNRDMGHLTTASADRFEGAGEAHRTHGHERAVLAQAVAYDHVWLDCVRTEEARDRLVDGEHRGLGDLGLAKLLLGGGGRRRIGGVDEQVVAEGSTQDRRHQPVGLGERVGHDRLCLLQGAQHVQILGALPRVQERERARARPDQGTRLGCAAPATSPVGQLRGP